MQASFRERVQFLRDAGTIAVVGASPKLVRPSNYISLYLLENGYRVIPVNPGHDELFGVKCYPRLSAIPESVDIVNVYRRPDKVLPIVQDAVARGDIQLIWMQDGVVNVEAEKQANAAGIPIVMDDCIFRVHRAEFH